MGPQLSAGGYVLPYISHIGMCRSKDYGFCAIFGLKTGKGMVFEGTTGVYERI